MHARIETVELDNVLQAGFEVIANIGPKLSYGVEAGLLLPPINNDPFNRNVVDLIARRSAPLPRVAELEASLAESEARRAELTRPKRDPRRRPPTFARRTQAGFDGT